MSPAAAPAGTEIELRFVPVLTPGTENVLPPEMKEVATEILLAADALLKVLTSLVILKPRSEQKRSG
jgi:hypothetical protein